MKIYFAGSISGGHSDRDIYYDIIEKLKAYGDVLTEHIELFEEGHGGEVSNEEMYTRDVEWICESDVIVAEITQPSLGVGYAIGRAETMGKPILCLYRMIPDRKISAMIHGNSYVTRVAYTNVGDIDKALKDFLA